MSRAPIVFLSVVLIACANGGAPKSAAPPSSFPDAASPPVVGGAPPAPRPDPESRSGEEMPGDGEGGGGAAQAPAPASSAPPKSASPAMRRTAEGHVAIAALKAQGIDEGALRGAIEQRLDALAACHEKELMRSPSLEGTANVELSLDAGGVVGVRASGLGDALLERCLEGVLGQMKVERADPGRGSARVRLILTRS